MTGSVKAAAHFDAAKDAEAVRGAMKGLGTNEQAIIDVVCHRSNAQRQEISAAYKQQFGRDFDEDIKSECGGNFLKIMQSLFRTPDQEDAFIVHHAVAGAGTDEDALIEVICTRSNAQLAAMKETYMKVYKKEAEKAILGDTSGDLKRLLVSLLTAHRADTCDAGDAKVDAEALYKAGEGKLGTDESKFNQILAARSYAQLRLTFDDYHHFSKNDIEKVIASEFSGDMKKGMLAIVKMIRNPAAYFAEVLYHSMKGAGTHDDQLIRVVVTRSEVDMEEIKHEFEKLYKKSLAKFIAEDTNGDYKKALLALVH